MKKFSILLLYFLAFMPGLVLTSCKDEPEVNFGFSEDISVNGFKFGPEGGDKSMRFSAREDYSPKVTVEMVSNPEDEWFSAKCEYDKGYGWKVCARTKANNLNVDRIGFIHIRIGKNHAKIAVRQAGDEKITFIFPPKVLPNAGGDFVLEFATSGTPQISFSSLGTTSDNPLGWCKFGNPKKTGTYTYELPVSYEANNSFGRITRMTVKTEWASESLTLIQRPVSFGDSVTVVTDALGGNLPLMLGYIGDIRLGNGNNGLDNIHNISHLKIKGGINDYDLDVLRAMTDRSRFKISLDLSEAKFVRSDNNPYEEYGYIPYKKEFDGFIFGNNCIPDGLFSGGSGLVSCYLPEATLEIGSRAFSFTSLQRIYIPKNVEVIKDDVFQSSYDLKDVYIDKFSKLRAIGSHILPSSYIDNLYLPSTLTEVADDAFIGMKVHNLYLDMAEPPTWKGFEGKHKYAHVDTLYLPDEKLIDVYKAAPGWGDIPVIRAWPEGWKNTPW